MPKVITVFQDYKKSLKDYSDHFDDLLSFKDIVGSQNCILEANGDFRISKYVGCLVKNNTCLQILPKIYSDSAIVDEDQEIGGSLSFVFRMLHWSGFMQFKELADIQIQENDNSLLEIIIRLFIDRFIFLHRRNVLREYISEEEELLFVKGKILFPISISTGIKRSGHLMVRFDELSINNNINRIIKSTIQQLLLISNDSENKKLLRLGLAYLDEVDFILLNNDLLNSIIFTRLNEEYRPLIELVKMLFQNRQSGINYGERRTISFIVPLNLLFEYFFKTILESIYESPDVVDYQTPKYIARDSNNVPRFQIKPDFVIRRGLNVVTILDTKFKNSFNKYGEIEVSSDDLYQMCTYAVSYGCKNIFLVYPLFVGQQKQQHIEQYKISFLNEEIHLTTIHVDLTVDNFDVIVDEVKSSLTN